MANTLRSRGRQAGRRHHAETSSDHGDRTEPSSAVELDAFANETLARADAAVRLRIAQLLGRKDAGHAVRTAWGA